MSNTNVYTHEFTCRDPDTELPVKFTLKITTKPPIEVDPVHVIVRVEQLSKRASRLEELADKFKSQFPGKLKLSTVRFGVRVEAQRDGTGL